MKKIYAQPEWKVVAFKVEDVITTSDGEKSYDPDGLFNKKADGWNWES